jgi:hypothetical protein
MIDPARPADWLTSARSWNYADPHGWRLERPRTEIFRQDRCFIGKRMDASVGLGVDRALMITIAAGQPVAWGHTESGRRSKPQPGPARS